MKYLRPSILSIFCCLLLPSLCTAKVWDAFSILDASPPNMCALTFDDGPHPRTIPILDALKEENAKATFFMLGMQVKYFPKIAKRVYEEGHDVGNHSTLHKNLRTLSENEVFADLQKTQKSLENLNIPVKFMRPPYGLYNKGVIRAADKLGLNTVIWSTDSRDWAKPKPDYSNLPNILERPFAYEEMRGVFLFHDVKLRTSKDIRMIIMTLRTMGCEKFVTLSELFDAAQEQSPTLPPKLYTEKEEKSIQAKTELPESIFDKSQFETLKREPLQSIDLQTKIKEKPLQKAFVLDSPM